MDSIYFQIDNYYTQHQEYLQTIITQITNVKHSNDASNLINKIDQYISNHESQQLERLKELATQSTNVYGFDKTIEKYSENIELFQRFFSTKYQLNALAEQLIDAEKAKAAADAEKLKEEKLKIETDALAAKHKHELEQKVSIGQTSEIRIDHRIEEAQHEQLLQGDHFPQQSPLFIRMLYDVTTQESEQYTLECQVQNYDHVQIEWFRNDEKIPNDHRNYRIYNDNGFCTLSINETRIDDSAIFTCRATNSLGSVETAARLLVLPSEKSDILSPPQFRKVLENKQTAAGSSIIFDCLVDGNPLPTVQWYKNDFCIDINPRYNFSYINGEAYLRLDDSIVDDGGIYTCIAKNMMGVNQCSATIIVNDVQSIDSHFQNGLLFIFIRSFMFISFSFCFCAMTCYIL